MATEIKLQAITRIAKRQERIEQLEKEANYESLQELLDLQEQQIKEWDKNYELIKTRYGYLLNIH